MPCATAILYIDRDDANLPKGSFFLADIYGLEVRNAQTDEVLGKVDDILTPPANNVYVVRGGKCEEIMIPAVDQFVKEINVDEGYMKVALIEGM